MSDTELKLKEGARIRIRTDRLPGGQRVRGQDVRVELVQEDGTVVPIPGMMSVFWAVDSRGSYATAHFVATGVELDVEAVEANAAQAVVWERDAFKRLFNSEIDKTARLYERIEQLEAQLREILYAESAKGIDQAPK